MSARGQVACGRSGVRKGGFEGLGLFFRPARLRLEGCHLNDVLAQLVEDEHEREEEADDPALQHALVQRLDVLDLDEADAVQPLQHVLQEPKAEEGVPANEAHARQTIMLRRLERSEQRVEVVEELARAEDCRTSHECHERDERKAEFARLRLMPIAADILAYLAAASPVLRASRNRA